MKKIAFLLCAAALLGTMSSCTSDADQTVKLTKVGTSEMTRTLMVTSNALADFTFGGQTVSNATSATFENAPEKGTLTVTPASVDYFEQNAIDVDFTDKQIVALDVQIAKRPSIEVSQEDMKNGRVVSNDAENQALTGVTASIAVPAQTTITGNTSSPFSIVTFVPVDGDQRITRADGNDGDANVLVMRCAADGAKFSEPVTVTLDIPESDGLDLYCMSEDGKEVLPLAEVGGNKREVKLSHFSDWITVMRATEEKAVTRGTPGEEISTFTISVKAGETITVKYQSKQGAVWTGGTKSTVVTNYLKTKVGKYVVSTLTSDPYTPSADGTVTYRVIQPYEDCSYKSGSAKFTARVYSPAHVEFDQPQGGHSGGGGR